MVRELFSRRGWLSGLLSLMSLPLLFHEKPLAAKSVSPIKLPETPQERLARILATAEELIDEAAANVFAWIRENGVWLKANANVPPPVTLPFASQPLNFYFRVPAGVKELRLPDVQRFLDAALHDSLDCPVVTESMLNRFFNKIRDMAGYVTNTAFRQMEPDMTFRRLIGPKLTVDVDELRVRDGQWLGYMSFLLLTALEARKDLPVPAGAVCQPVVDCGIYARREAFMLEMFSYCTVITDLAGHPWQPETVDEPVWSVDKLAVGPRRT